MIDYTFEFWYSLPLPSVNKGEEIDRKAESYLTPSPKNGRSGTFFLVRPLDLSIYVNSSNHEIAIPYFSKFTFLVGDHS